MKHALSDDDRDFVTQFLANAIEPGRFHHRQHLRLAYIFLVEHGSVVAYAKFRDALQAFLRHNAIDPMKYHTTLTQAWLLAVNHFMETSPPAIDSEQFIGANTRLLDPKIMMTHYSAQLIWSDRARASFVEPDIQSIPRH